MQNANFQLAERLAELERAQLVRAGTEPDPTYLFKHALTQDTVYQSLLKATRADLHRRVAQALEQLGWDQFDQNAALMAWHYERAGVQDRAFEYTVRAGDRAARAFAHSEALAFYNRALGLAAELLAPDRELQAKVAVTPVYLQKGRIQEVMGDNAAALETYRSMIEFAELTGDPAMQVEGLNHVVTVQVVLTGATPETEQLLERAGALARRVGDPALVARTLWNQGLTWRFIDPPRASDYFLQALGLAREAYLREMAAFVRLDLQIALVLQGHARQARENVQQALEEFRVLDIKPMIADALEAMAYYAYARGEPAAGRAFAGEGLEISRAIENPWGVLNNQIELIILDFAAGRLADVLRETEHILGSVRHLGNPTFILGCYSLLAQAWLELNQPARANTWVESAIADFGADPNPHFIFWANWLRALVLIKRGEPGPAHEILAPLMESRSIPLTPFDRYNWVGSSLVEMALLEGRVDEGLALCERLIGAFEREELAGLAAGIYYRRARLNLAAGDRQQAERDALRAREALERAGNRILLWRTEALLADLAEGQGNEAAALEARERAGAILKYIAEHSPAV